VEFLLPEGELAFQIGNPFRLLLKLFTKPFVLVLQSLDFACLAIADLTQPLRTGRSRLALRLHQPERMKSLQKVQVQNADHRGTGPELLRKNSRRSTPQTVSGRWSAL